MWYYYFTRYCKHSVWKNWTMAPMVKSWATVEWQMAEISFKKSVDQHGILGRYGFAKKTTSVWDMYCTSELILQITYLPICWKTVGCLSINVWLAVYRQLTWGAVVIVTKICRDLSILDCVFAKCRRSCWLIENWPRFG